MRMKFPYNIAVVNNSAEEVNITVSFTTDLGAGTKEWERQYTVEGFNNPSPDSDLPTKVEQPSVPLAKPGYYSVSFATEDGKTKETEIVVPEGGFPRNQKIDLYVEPDGGLRLIHAVS